MNKTGDSDVLMSKWLGRWAWEGQNLGLDLIEETHMKKINEYDGAGCCHLSYGYTIFVLMVVSTDLGSPSHF